MPAKKKAKASLRPTSSAMYDVVTGTHPNYAIVASQISLVEERRRRHTYSTAGLKMTVGRVGLSAFLSPDEKTICVVGGDVVACDDEDISRWDGLYPSTLSSFSVDSTEEEEGPNGTESDFTHDSSGIPQAAEMGAKKGTNFSHNRSSNRRSQPSVKQPQQKRASSSSPAGSGSDMLPPPLRATTASPSGEFFSPHTSAAASGGKENANIRHAATTPPKRKQNKALSATSGKNIPHRPRVSDTAAKDLDGEEVSLASVPTHRRYTKIPSTTASYAAEDHLSLSLSPPPVDARLGLSTVSGAPLRPTLTTTSSSHAQPYMPSPPLPPITIPVGYRTTLPLMECFSIAASSWYIPRGERQRAAACQGIIRWPTQAAVVVVWRKPIPPPTPSPGMNSLPPTMRPGTFLRVSHVPSFSPSMGNAVVGHPPSWKEGEVGSAESHGERIGKRGPPHTAATAPPVRGVAEGKGEEAGGWGGAAATAGAAPHAKKRVSRVADADAVNAAGNEAPKGKMEPPLPSVGSVLPLQGLPPKASANPADRSRTVSPTPYTPKKSKGVRSEYTPSLRPRSDVEVSHPSPHATVSHPPCPPAAHRAHSLFDDGPSTVILIGGWDGLHRLCTIMVYNTTVPPVRRVPPHTPQDTTDASPIASPPSHAWGKRGEEERVGGRQGWGVSFFPPMACGGGPPSGTPLLVRPNGPAAPVSDAASVASLFSPARCTVPPPTMHAASPSGTRDEVGSDDLAVALQDLLVTSIPQVTEMLPIPPLTNATAVLVKDQLFMLGGNTSLRGSLDEFYVLENACLTEGVVSAQDKGTLPASLPGRVAPSQGRGGGGGGGGEGGWWAHASSSPPLPPTGGTSFADGKSGSVVEPHVGFLAGEEGASRGSLSTEAALSEDTEMFATTQKHVGSTPTPRGSKGGWNPSLSARKEEEVERSIGRGSIPTNLPSSHPGTADEGGAVPPRFSGVGGSGGTAPPASPSPQRTLQATQWECRLLSGTGMPQRGGSTVSFSPSSSALPTHGVVGNTNTAKDSAPLNGSVKEGVGKAMPGSTAAAAGAHPTPHANGAEVPSSFSAGVGSRVGMVSGSFPNAAVGSGVLGVTGSPLTSNPLALMMMLSPSPVVTTPATPSIFVRADLPGPSPRSSHAVAVLQNRYIVCFGGRQCVLPAAVGAPHGKSKTKSGNAGSSAGGGARRPKGRSGGKSESKEKDGKGNRHPGGRKESVVLDEEEEDLPTLQLYGDLAVYDTEMRGWIQVRVVGSDTPSPRYGAAMCLLPPPIPSPSPNLNASSAVPSPTVLHELVLHGGFGEKDVILRDMWILQVVAWNTEEPPVSGSNGKKRKGQKSTSNASHTRPPSGPPGAAQSSAMSRGASSFQSLTSPLQNLVAVDAECGIPTMHFRFVQVVAEFPRPRSSQSSSRAETPSVAMPSIRLGRPTMAASDGMGGSASTTSAGALPPSDAGAGKGSVSTEGGGNPTALGHPLTSSTFTELPPRAQHAIIATSQREVFIIGGVQPFIPFGGIPLFSSPSSQRGSFDVGGGGKLANTPPLPALSGTSADDKPQTVSSDSVSHRRSTISRVKEPHLHPCVVVDRTCMVKVSLPELTEAEELPSGRRVGGPYKKK